MAVNTTPSTERQNIFAARDEVAARAEAALIALSEAMADVTRLNVSAYSRWAAELERAANPLDVQPFEPFIWSAKVEYLQGLRNKLIHVTLGTDDTNYGQQMADAIAGNRRRKHEAREKADREAEEKLLKEHPELGRIIDRRVRDRVSGRALLPPHRPG